MQMPNLEHLQEKWAPILNHEGMGNIQDAHRRAVTAQLLENQEQMLREEREFLSEGPTNSVAQDGVKNFDPVLISLIRRSMPNLIAYDVAGVQPMNGPTGLIFAMRSRYTGMGGDEALFNEADSAFSGQREGFDATQAQRYVDNSEVESVGFGTTAQSGVNPGALNDSGAAGTDYNVGQGMSTADAEGLGEANDNFNQMAFSIEKVTVTAKSRALKAEYSLELAQDLKAIHGLNAEAELANILSTEILAEINREVIRTLNTQAKTGASTANTAVNGIFDLSTDADGRWSVEKFKGLIVQVEREANIIAKETRRGKGNFMICSSDVASALAASGMLDYSPAMSTALNVDDTGNTFAGTLNGRTRVYIDPYATADYVNVGYKGTNPYDAGVFYCPYVPLTMVRAVGEDTFQPKIGFKTRYGMASNPFVGDTPADGLATVKTNQYYRIFRVDNILA